MLLSSSSSDCLSESVFLCFDGSSVCLVVFIRSALKFMWDFGVVVASITLSYSEYIVVFVKLYYI